ncbi:MAG: hypothetical protein ACRC1M_02460 [Methanobacteriaceae archaeon]
MNIIFLVNQNHFDWDEASPRQVFGFVGCWCVYGFWIILNIVI